MLMICTSFSAHAGYIIQTQTVDVNKFADWASFAPHLGSSPTTSYGFEQYGGPLSLDGILFSWDLTHNAIDPNYNTPTDLWCNCSVGLRTLLTKMTGTGAFGNQTFFDIQTNAHILEQSNGWTRYDYDFNTSFTTGLNNLNDFIGSGNVAGSIDLYSIIMPLNEAQSAPRIQGSLTLQYISEQNPNTFQNSQPVPTPSTVTLIGLGLAGLGFGRRRKQSSY